MAAIRYFRVQVNEGSKAGIASFYETDQGAFDLKFGFARYTSRMHSTLAEAIEDFRQHLQAEHDSNGDGITVSLDQPIEIDLDRVERPAQNS